jgi:hypothetical protein
MLKMCFGRPAMSPAMPFCGQRVAQLPQRLLDEALAAAAVVVQQAGDAR